MVSEPDNGWCASKDAGPRRGEDCEIPHRLERGTSASVNVGPRRGVDCEIPHQGNEAFFIRVWKPLPSKCVLKTLREARKGKPKEGSPSKRLLERFRHPYKKCFVLLPNRYGISQSTPFGAQRPY